MGPPCLGPSISPRRRSEEQRKSDPRLRCLLLFITMTSVAAGQQTNGSVACSTPLNRTACLSAQAQMLSIYSDRLRTPPANITATSLEDDFNNLLAVCLSNEPAPLRTVNVLAPLQAQSLTSKLQGPLMQALPPGFQVSTDFQDISRLSQIVAADITQGTNFYDGFVTESSGIIDMAHAGAYADWRAKLLSDLSFHYSDIDPFVREVASVFGGNIVLLPWVSSLPYLWYRRDLFERYNLSVPQTWEDLLTVGRRMNGTDFNNDGRPDPAFCFTYKSPLLGYGTLLTILSSYVQTQGPKQGVLFDRDTLDPLVNNAAMAKAMSIYRELASLSEDVYDQDVSLLTTFKDGTCLAVVRGADVFKSSVYSAPEVIGNIGCAMVPGSYEVLDRSRGTLVPCTPSTCIDTVTLANGTQRPINRAIYSGIISGVGIGVNPHTDPAYKDLIFRSGMYLLSPEVSFQLFAFNPECGAGPIRDSHFSEASLQNWTRLYNLNDTKGFLAITRASINHPNRGKEVAFVNIVAHRSLIMSMIPRILDTSASIPSIMADLHAGMVTLVKGSGPADTVRSLYWLYLGYSPASSPSDQSSSELSHSQLVAATVVPVLGGLALLAAVLLVLLMYLHRSRHHRTLLGHIKPPPASPETTLLLTDIQDSTPLWEELPSEIMDAALHMHHHVIRKAALAHQGYESGTEGDAFILAFHTATDAVRFAVAAQEALTQCDWLEELLATPQCAPMWVRLLPGAYGTVPQPSLIHGTSVVAALTSVLDHGGFSRRTSLPAALTALPDTFGQYPDEGPGSNRTWGRRNTLTGASGGGHTVSSHTISGHTISGHAHHTSPSLQGSNSLSHYAAGVAPPRSHGGGCTEHMGTQQHLSSRLSISSEPKHGLQTRDSATAVQGSDALGTDVSGVVPMVAALTQNSLGGAAGDGMGNQRPSCSASGEGLHPGLLACTLGPTTFCQMLSAKVQLLPGSLSAIASGDSPDATNSDAKATHDGAGTGVSNFNSRSSPLRAVSQAGAVAAAFLGSKQVSGDGRQSLQQGGGSGITKCLFRGLRVRMGMHTGIADASLVKMSRENGRVLYTGPSMLMAKAVQDAAQGGMILLSEASFTCCSTEALRAETIVIAHMGQHELKGIDMGAVHMYTAVTRGLLIHRLPFLGPVRSVRQCSSPFLDAPHGSACIVYLQALHISSLRAWNAEITAQALDLYEGIAKELLGSLGGYLNTAADGLVLAAFPALPSTAPALRWALSCVRSCLHAPWPQELLEHELGDEVVMRTFGRKAAVEIPEGLQNEDQGLLNNPGNDSQAAAAAAPATLSTLDSDVAVAMLTAMGKDGTSATTVKDLHQLQASSTADNPADGGMIHDSFQVANKFVSALSQFPALGPKVLLRRGLRLKAGIDVGEVKTDIHAVSGRATYLGKVMNRAARIMGAAPSGSVYCSALAWIHAMRDINMPPPQQQLHSQPSGSVISSAPPTPLKGGTAGTTGAPAHVAQRDQITACSVGAHKLKGIQGDQLLMEVRFASDVLEARVLQLPTTLHHQANKR